MTKGFDDDASGLIITLDVIALPILDVLISRILISLSKPGASPTIVGDSKAFC